MLEGGLKWGLDFAKAPKPVQASLEPILRFFSYHDAHPVAMTMVLLEKFGHEWFVWEPDTLRQEILQSFRATSISEHNWQKLQAVRTVVNSLGPWTEWEIFEKVVQALNNNVPRFDILQRCSLAQLMAGVDMIGTLRSEQYNDEVAKYVASCALEEGVIYTPAPLEFAQKYLSKPTYECLDCGTVAEDDNDDGRCDFCSGRFADDKPLNFQPSRFVPADRGKNLRRYLQWDPESTKRRFEELKIADNIGKLDEESAEDVQASKLMVAYQYTQMRRRQLVDQLEELKSWVTH